MVFKCTVLLITAAAAAGFGQQPSSGLERRIADLEAKMRQLDPAFGATVAPELAVRLEALEKKMETLLAARAVPAPTPTPAPVAAQPLELQSVSGDFQKSSGGETRLPVAGYMDFHLNKERGDFFRPDFHRFVLLFGHGFSDRIKFWSELEIEHSLVEGGEAKAHLF